jgi:hypothetical protein
MMNDDTVLGPRPDDPTGVRPGLAWSQTGHQEVVDYPYEPDELDDENDTELLVYAEKSRATRTSGTSRGRRGGVGW